jgi:hypothetical protein
MAEPNDAITEIITNAMDDAEIGESSEDTSLPDETPEVETGDPGDETDKPATEDKTAKPVDEDEAFTKELEGYGIHAPKPGERENRIPYSRVRKIIANAFKKKTGEHTTALTERDTKLTAAEAKVAAQERVNALAETNPERFLDLAAQANPKVWGPLRDRFKAAPSTTVVAPKPDATLDATIAALGPMPQPDGKYTDGSVGYTPEGLEKLMQWREAIVEAKAVHRATKMAEEAFTKRFGPIEDKWKVEETNRRLLPGVQAKIAWGKKTYGKLFEDDYKLDSQAEVVKVLRENTDPRTGVCRITFEQACAQVFVPKLQANRDTMRTDLLKELNERPAAADKTPKVGGKSRTSDDDGPKDLEDVIRGAMASANLR